MNNVKTYLCCLAIILFRMRLLNAQGVPNTSSNQSNSPSSVQPRFFDPGVMGFPNFDSGTSNYPTNSFPFGNQNNNMQQPQHGSGFDNQNQNPNQGNYDNRPVQGGYPNQEGLPFQGNSMNPSPNYQPPGYPNNQNDGSMNAYQNPSQGNFQNRPIQEGFPNQDGYPYQGDSMNPYPHYQRPDNPNNANGANMYPGTINSPYQNEGMPSYPGQDYNQPGQGGQGPPIRYPSQDGQYPSQGNFQGNPNLRPDELNNFSNANVQFPNRPYQNQPNQYYPQNFLPNPGQHFMHGSGQPTHIQPYPSNHIRDPNIIFPTNNPGVNPSNPSIQFPVNSNPGAVTFPGSVNPGDINNQPQNRPQLHNNEGIGSNNDPNYNNTVAILGKPVILPGTSLSPGQVVFDSSTAGSTQTKCILDCQTTSEYNPVCGSNNVTYINPGKLYCAQNCGLPVSLQKKGRCDGDEGTDLPTQ